MYYNLKVTETNSEYYSNYEVNGIIVTSKKGNRGSYRALLSSNLIVFTDWYSKTMNNDSVLVKVGDSIIKENSYFKVYHKKNVVGNYCNSFDTLYYTYLDLDTTAIKKKQFK